MVVVLVRLPDLPVTVMLPVPTVAELLAEIVTVLDPVAGLGLKEAVTPLGKLELEKVTLLLKPLDGVMVIVLLPLEPCAIVRLLGDADSVKSGCDGGAVPVTVRLMVVVRVKLPDVPVTVTMVVPVAAELPAEIVNILDPVAELGLKEAVKPLGKLELVKETLLLKPLTGVMLIVLLPLEPCAIVRLPGDADKEKSG